MASPPRRRRRRLRAVPEAARRPKTIDTVRGKNLESSGAGSDPDPSVSSFYTKYHYNLWRPETAIRRGDTDGNPKTDPNSAFAPFILTPCFPSYPSNHASGTNGGAEMLRRLYGAGGHDIVFANPAVPGVVLHYSNFKKITDDVDDARVYGGIHFRFDQDAGGRLGRGVATYIIKNNLRPVHPDADAQ